MAGIVPSVGRVQFLQLATGTDAQENISLKLFVNDIDPDVSTVLGDFTEAGGGGYALKTLTAGSFTIATAAGVTTATYAKQTWTFTGALNAGATVYGVYGVGATSGELIFAERASAANQLTPAADDTYSYSFSATLSG